MPDINWKLLNERTFVYLVADLLRDLGFRDIEFQGDGPDGGLDLFATQFVYLGFEEYTSFRWAIQSKFSLKPGRRSVSDSDVKDVEGILRSKRYSAENLRGYLLVTNRRVSQNVYERLRGIDSRSQYRTSVLEGPKLELLLEGKSALIDRYFGNTEREISGLGAPVLSRSWIGNNDFSIPLSLRSRDSTNTWFETAAGIDFGADILYLPNALIGRVYRQRTSASVTIAGLGGLLSPLIPVYIVDVGLAGAPFSSQEAVFIDVGKPIIGRSILKNFVVRMDGPNKIFELWDAGHVAMKVIMRKPA